MNVAPLTKFRCIDHLAPNTEDLVIRHEASVLGDSRGLAILTIRVPESGELAADVAVVIDRPGAFDWMAFAVGGTVGDEVGRVGAAVVMPPGLDDEGVGGGAEEEEGWQETHFWFGWWWWWLLVGIAVRR